MSAADSQGAAGAGGAGRGIGERHDVIQVAERYYILATSTIQDDRVHVLKDGESFAIFDRRGDVFCYGLSPQGLFLADTRFLSKCTLLLEGQGPLLLSSTVHSAGALLVVDLTNADIAREGAVVVPHGQLHVCRTLLLRDGTLRQRFKVSNFGPGDVDIALAVDVDADFTDVFEVRGHVRAARGTRQPVELGKSKIAFGYVGLDGVTRRTVIVATPCAAVEGRCFTFRLHVPARSSRSVHVTARCHELPSHRKRRLRPQLLREHARVSSSSTRLEGWIERSLDDLRMMLTRTAHGPYPYAGVPWFSTAFGRDGIITALETLWVDPSIARGVLGFLAATQARDVDQKHEAQPGKILHEMRVGEMARCGEVPFGKYYGSVDATPLFVMLAGAHLQFTGDKAFAAELWPHVESALRWMDEYGDVDGDGFIEYTSAPRGGLVHQGWKDSEDSVFHEDGTSAESPIALCEVQAYAFAARLAAARIARVLGRPQRAIEEESKAESLRALFEEKFWSDEQGTYGIALDAKKRLCRVRTSNAGHCLWCGIVSKERAPQVAAALLDERSFSGWGVRTVARGSARYNPMSYHNGSIWPHDNAIIAAGLARYGFKRDAARIMHAMLDATRHFELQRLPELFCGFARSHGKGPTLYPVACSPQAWASGAVYMLIAACLGLDVDALERRVYLKHPHMPPTIRELDIHGLRVGPDASVDLALHRYPDGVGADVRSRVGPVEVVMLK